MVTRQGLSAAMPTCREGVLCVVVAAAFVGCSDKPVPPRKSAGGGAIAAAPVDPDSAITVDDGRASVRSPVGWRRGSRSDDYAVRYTPGAQKTFPAVVVIAADPPTVFDQVTAENHGAFVAAVADQLADTFTSGGKSTLLEKPAAVTLGPHRGVSWAAPGTAKIDGLKQPIERSCLAIVFAGRMYTVEARAPRGKLDASGRAAARGVAAGIAAPVAAEPSSLDEPAAAASPAE